MSGWAGSLSCDTNPGMEPVRSLILLVVGLFLSTGCIVLPAPERVERNDGDKPVSNIPSLLGDPGSDKPVRVGQPRDQLHAILGTPNWMSADRSIELYDISRTVGYIFFFIPLTHMWGGGPLVYDPKTLLFRFDPQDRLAAWEFGDGLKRADGYPVHYRAGGTEVYRIDDEKGWPTTRP